MHRKYVSYGEYEKKRDIRCHDKHEAMYYDKAGSLSLYLGNHVKFVYGKKSCFCVRH